MYWGGLPSWWLLSYIARRLNRQPASGTVLSLLLLVTSWRWAIRLERRLELAFEGIHLFDTRSYRTTEKDVTKPVYGIDPDGKKILIETRKFNPNRDYLWAIPLKEIDLSQGVLKQNPEWD